jgi:flagellar hook-basal body complex protein FliE
MNPITPISLNSLQSVPGVSPGSSGQVTQGTTRSNEFSNVIKKVVSEANQNLSAADKSIQDLASGKSDNMQDVVMSMAKADLSFRFVLELRNKLMDAYQEIMRMQV